MKENISPRDIACEVISELFEKSSKKDHSIFIPFATANLGLSAIIQQVRPQLICYQTFKTEVDALKKLGVTCVQELPKESYDEVLFVPTKQRIESLGLLAFSILNLRVGGRLIYCCHNQLGAGGFNSKIKEIFPELEIESAKKCRYFILNLKAPLNGDQKTILNSWIEASSTSLVPSTEYKSVPGIFGWNKVDRGSELLISTLPELSGSGADLGAGYGYLSHQVFSRFKDVNSIALVEAEERSLSCAKENLKNYQGKCRFPWLDVCNDETRKSLGTFDWIIMNPPFHDENLVDQDLGKEFIRSASLLLKKGGTLYMVANEFLAYEKLLKEVFSKVDQVLTQDGFKVFHAKR